MEVDKPQFNEEGKLVAGELVITSESYHPTRWCRDDKRVRPKVSSLRRSSSPSSLKVRVHATTFF